jgi:hypothetical protein
VFEHRRDDEAEGDDALDDEEVEGDERRDGHDHLDGVRGREQVAVRRVRGDA